MDFLKRSIAPITEIGWQYIRQEATAALSATLSARRFVDVVGPKGFDFSAVNLGSLTGVTEESKDGVRYGIRQVLPLVEARIPFSLDIQSIDGLSRGATDANTDPLIDACRKLATFEERAIFYGFSGGGIRGLTESNGPPQVPLGQQAALFPDAVAKALLQLTDAGVGGPLALVLGQEAYRALVAELSPYPPRERIAQMIEGPILYSRVLKGGLLASMRGGDFELTLGQDASIGYVSHDESKVDLYVTETFTFRVISPEAVVVFT